MKQIKEWPTICGSNFSVNALLASLALLGFAARVSVAQTCVPPPSGLVSWWAAEGNANDSFGPNTGVLKNGVTFAAGEVGQAFNFNGVNQYVLLSNTASLNPAGSFSIEAWVYLTAGAQDNVIMAKWGGDTDYNNMRSYSLHVNASQAIAFSICDAANQGNGSSPYQAFLSSNNVVPLNTWTHVAAVYDQSTGTRWIYVNGVSVASRTDPPITILNTIANAAIGAYLISSTQPLAFFGGKIDEVSFYNRALSGAEVAGIFSAGTSGKCAAPPVITSQPQGQSVATGTTVAFTAGAGGTLPLSFQWQLNGTNISTTTNATATNATLTLTNVQPGQSGGYSVLVSNIAGTTNSGSAALTVVPPGSCLPPPSGLVSWWSAEGNAADSVGTNNGVPKNGVTFAAGEVGQAFNLNGVNQYVLLSNSPSLNPAGSFSIEAWIYVTAGAQDNVIMAKWGGDLDYNNMRSYSFHVNASQALVFSICDAANQQNGGSPYQAFLSPNGVVPLNTWTHVAAVYDQSTGARGIYVNGVSVASRTDPPITILNSIANAAIGAYLLASTEPLAFFGGKLDEVSFYNRALSGVEVASIYSVGTSGKCHPIAPIITAQPTNQTVLAGSTVNFGVGVTGTPPLAYQWQLNGTNISATTNLSATNASLILTNVQLGQSGGLYSVLVSNSAGSTNSSNAVLTVTPPVATCQPPPSGLVSWFAAEGNANDSLSTNVGALLNSATFAAGEVGQAFSFNGTGAHARVHDAPNLHFTNAMTWEVWIYPTAYNGAIIDKWDAVPGHNQFSYGMSIGSDGRVSVALYPISGSGFVQMFTTSTITLGQWTHVAATYDGATVKVYLNGVLNNSAAYTGGIFPGTDDLGIGGQVGGLPSGSVNVPFAGLIDEVSAYNRALASNEIAAIYSAGSSGKCPLPPLITGQPASQNVLVASTVNFSVGATGSQPLGYQWKLNGTNIPAAANATATNATLTVTNVQTSQSGNTYSVLVSNGGGSTNSTNAVLTVTPPTSCQPPPSGLVSWFVAEGNASDSLSTNVGALLNGATFAAGEVGQAFSFNGTGAHVRVHDAPNLHFTNAMTWEVWIYPTAYNGAIIDKWDAVAGHNQFSYSLGLVSDGRIAVSLYPISGSGFVQMFTTSTIALGQWTHLAATYDGATVKVYLNGVLNNSTAYTGGIFPGTDDLGIGGQVGGEPVGTVNVPFAGLIDEISAYNRALASNEIAAIYLAGSSGKCRNTPPVITGQPTNQTVVAGNTASFSVGAAGSLPLAYQWKLNGSNILAAANPTATNATLTLTNVQLGQSGGSYSALVSNSAGSTNSSNAVLTVTPPVATCQPPPSGLVSWFAAEGNANDSLSTNVGALLNSATFAAGEVGQAFSFNGTGAHARVHDAPNLHFTNAMTWEVWIYPTAYNGAIIDKWDAVPGHNQFSYGMSIGSDGRVSVALYPISGSGFVQMFTTSTITLGQWTHVAATYDGATVKVYLNGVLNNSAAYTGGIFPGTDDLGIGGQVGGLPSGSVNVPFAGLIDEVSAYNRALASNEIAAIYSAGSSGKCPLPPLITGQPASQNVLVASTVNFSVGATGSQPLGYQWKLNGTNIPAAANATATNATLTVTNVQTSQSGNTYSVLVSNGGGSTNSTNAVLTVSPQTSCVPQPPGLVGWWQAEGNAADSAGTNNGVLENGVTFTNGEVGQAFSLNGSGAHVRVADSPGLRFSNAMTLEAWIYPTNTLGADRSILMKWDAVIGPNQRSYYYEIAADGRLAFGVTTNGLDSGIGGVFSTGALPANQWTHVVGTYDGAMLKVYLNGALNNATNFSGGIFQGSDDLGIGAIVGGEPNGGGISLFAGLIDEASVYNRALTASEIQAIYFAGSSGKCPLPPLIASQPASQTVIAGTTVNFAVGATGSQPLGYQWKLNGTNISASTNASATNATLTLTNVQLGLSGGLYSVLVSNGGGATNSSNAVLTVTPAINCLPPPSGLVSWWQAEGNANDSAGTNNGTIHGAAGFTNGEAGQAFQFDGATGYVSIPASASLNVGTNAGFTIEGWIKPASLTVNAPLTEWNNGTPTGYGSHFWINQPTSASGNGPGSLFANLVDTGGTYHLIASPAMVLNTNSFQHVALTFNKTNGAATLYLNGTAVASQTFGAFTPQTSYSLYFATRPAAGFFYPGLMDELSLYNTALTSNQIQAIYNAGSSGKCPLPPLITSQPTSQTVAPGSTVNFGVSATGSQPLGYQWKLNGTNISATTNASATNATLTLTNVQLAQTGGSYSVLVSNSGGATNSSNAVLAVTPPVSCLPPPSGLVSWWQAEGNAGDSVGTNNGTLLNGAAFAAGKVGQAFSFNGTSSHVRVHDAPNLRFTNAMTLEAWIYPTSVGGGNVRAVIVKWDTVIGPNQRAYGLNLAADGTISLGIDMAGTGTTGVNSVESTNVMPTGQWTHVAGTYDGTTLKVYVNGALNNSLAFAGSIFPGTADLGVGAAVGEAPAGGGLTFFAGLIDEASAYNRALTSNEIAAIYNAGSLGKCLLPPLITSQPTNQTVIAGTTVNFGVSVTGSQPLGYQWKLNGTNISATTNASATNATLTLTNVQLAQTGGSYSVLVSNGGGATNSSNAVLTVTPLVSCVAPPSGLVSWFAADGTAGDLVSTNVGALLNGATFAAGEVSQAFSLSAPGAHVRVHDAPNLHFTNAMTWEVWIKPVVVGGGGGQAIIDKWDAVPGPNQVSYGLGIVPDGRAAMSLCASGVGTSFVTVYTTNPITAGQWTHLATTYDGATLKIYLNGALNNSLAYTGGIFPGTDDLGIGGQVGGEPSGTAIALFSGLIDEVSAYNRALTSNEITAVYNADGSGKCRVTVPPVIVSQPANQTAPVGYTVNFAVSATGSQPLGYQWKLNGSNILTAANPTATNATLVLTNVQLAQSGNLYSVLVSNSGGSTNSSNAVLNVTPASCLPPPPGLISWWKGEGNAGDSFGTNNGVLQNGAGFTNGEVGQAFNLNGTNQFIRIANSASLNPTGSFSIEGWIFLTQSAGEQGIMVKWGDTGDYNNQRSYIFATGAGDALNFAISDVANQGNASFHTFLTSNNIVPLNTWTHVAAVYDQGTGTRKIYVNGINVASRTDAPITVLNGIADVGIGGKVGSSTFTQSFLPGRIDEVSFYNRALTAAEIQAIYNTGSSGKCPLPPLITSQPTNQTVPVGSTVNFTVGATGTPPFAYQWKLNGSNILAAANPTATNATLTVTNVQLAQSGNIYSVLVSNNAGSTNSSNAVLNVTPTSCLPPPSGLVGWWTAEGNALDSAGTNNGILENGAGFAAGKAGQAFNLSSAGMHVRIHDSPALHFSNAVTFEAWINPVNSVSAQGQPVFQKWDAVFGVNQRAWGFGLNPNGTAGLGIDTLGTGTTGWSQVNSANVVPANQWTHIAGTYDGTTIKIYVNGVLSGSTTFPGSIFPSTADVAIGADVGGEPNGGYIAPFVGLIDEVSAYNRALTAAEILAIYNAGSAGKCNTTVPPIITSQPTNQTVPVGSTVNFAVGVSGTPPFTYQWKLNGSNILAAANPTATNATLTLTNVQTGQSGNLYSVLVSNNAGSTNSSNAVLNVVPAMTTLQVISVTASNGVAVVPVDLLARGNENALDFSISFDPTLLTFIGVTPGSGAGGGLILSNTNQLAGGKLGLGIALPANGSFAPGTREVMKLNFTVPPVTSAMVSVVMFGDQPAVRQVSDAQANPVAALYQDGTVTIPFLGYEGEVTPRPNSDRTNSTTDWVEVGRFVAGLDFPTNGNEFQRADCAPRGTLGDGMLTASDWVQAGRYALGLDPQTPAGGPTGPASPMFVASGNFTPQVGNARTITASSGAAQAGQPCQVSIQLNSQGDEAAMGFSVTFDSTVLTLAGVEQGTGAGGTLFNVNTNQPGVVGLALTLPIGSTFTAATQELAKLDFIVTPGAASPTTISFAGQPVIQEVASSAAQPLPTAYVNGRLDITPLVVAVGPTLSVSTGNGNVTISWPAGTTGFALESTGDPLSTNWTAVTATPATNSTSISVTVPANASQQFYRLRSQ